MTQRAFRPLATLISLLLLAAVPAQASPVTLADVIQVISGNPRSGGQAATVQLRYAPQEDRAQKSNTTSSTSSQQQEGGTATTQQQQGTQSPTTTTVQAQSEEVGEIEVGDCECGELPDEIVEIPGRRSFLPYLPLVGLICVTGICKPPDNPPNTPPTTPTPPPETPVPEPATLLLFGSGLAALGAGARRRYARTKLSKSADTTEG